MDICAIRLWQGGEDTIGMEDLANKSSNNTTSYMARQRVMSPGTLSLIGFLPTWFSMRFLMRLWFYTPVGDCQVFFWPALPKGDLLYYIALDRAW